MRLTQIGSLARKMEQRAAWHETRALHLARLTSDAPTLAGAQIVADHAYAAQRWRTLACAIFGEPTVHGPLEQVRE